jgi:hypothetical protein
MKISKFNKSGGIIRRYFMGEGELENVQRMLHKTPAKFT